MTAPRPPAATRRPGGGCEAAAAAAGSCHSARRPSGARNVEHLSVKSFLTHVLIMVGNSIGNEKLLVETGWKMNWELYWEVRALLLGNSGAKIGKLSRQE